jgi:hypothetical protein
MHKLLLILFLSISTCSWAQNPAPVLTKFVSSDLPIVIIDTHQQTILDDPKITADLGIIDNGPRVRNFLTDSYNNYIGKVGIELRGSSSQGFPKKSFGFETRNAKGEDLDASLLGMPAGSDWVLSASYSDKTLMRNVLTYGIGRDAGSYASRTRYCEVVLNDVYQGVYVLMEKIKRGPDRVNISKLKVSDKTGDAVTGGYILKFDKTTGTPNANWVSKFKNPINPAEDGTLFQVEYPKLEDINAAQLSYIQAYTDSLETALSTGGPTDARKGYRHYINTASFIDFFLLTELSRNVDGYTFSTYLYKDRTSKGGKLTMGPLWDYDIAWSNANYCAGNSASGWVYNQGCGHVPFWWRTLLADPVFVQELQARWAVLRASILQEETLNQRIDVTAAQLAESQERNFTAWPTLGTYVWPNPVVLATYAEEVDYLKRWVHSRLLWMDANLPGRGQQGVATGNRAPVSFIGASAFPLPFTTTLTVAYALPSNSDVTVTLVDMLGKQVYQQELGRQTAGDKTITIDGCADLTPGIYLLRLTSVGGSRTLRVVRTAS